MTKTLIAVLIFAALAFGQAATTLPTNFAGAGLGFQDTANPQVAGWERLCHANPSVTAAGLTFSTYSCEATFYSSKATSAVVEEKIVLLHKAWFTGGISGNGGAALNTNGVGGSMGGGGWVTAGIGKWLGIPGAMLVAEVDWQKANVAVAVAQTKAGVVLGQLATSANVQLGVGKVW
jgi:hypothetical protein